MNRKLATILGLMLIPFFSSFQAQASSLSIFDEIPDLVIYNLMETRDYRSLNKIALTSNQSYKSQMARTFLNQLDMNQERILNSFNHIAEKGDMRNAITNDKSKVIAFFNGNGEVVATIAYSEYWQGGIAPIYTSDYTDQGQFFDQAQQLLTQYHNKQQEIINEIDSIKFSVPRATADELNAKYEEYMTFSRNLFQVLEEIIAENDNMSFVRFDYRAFALKYRDNHEVIQVTDHISRAALNIPTQLMIDATIYEAVDRAVGTPQQYN